MSKIIIDVEYFGAALKIAREKNRISTTQMTHLFGCSAKQLHRYENGTDLIPRDIMVRIFKYAAMMDAMPQDNPLR